MSNSEKDLYKAILSLRTVREFADEPVSEESLQRILQAGRWAGSAKNIQPWQFIVIREHLTMEKLSTCGQFSQHLPGAPLAIAIISDQVRLAGFDAGRAAQNMMLAAWAEGIGSGIATMHDQACARQVLGVPEEKDIAIVLDFGYPAHEGSVKSKMPNAGRRSMQDIVHNERW
jgi:nitroreductase